MAGIESCDDDVLAPQQEDALPSPSLQALPATLHAQDAAQNTRNRKKIKSAELEDMHAASQRLLRETPNASFKPQVTTGKSITSVLEKIRMRKTQLVQGRRSTFSVFRPDGSDPLDILNDKRSSFRSLAPNPLVQDEGMNIQEIEVQKTLHRDGIENAGEEVSATSILEGHADEFDLVKTPEIHALGDKSDDMEKSAYQGSGNSFRAPMEDTQELDSISESSDNDFDEDLNLDRDNDEAFGGSRVNLHLDTETQDNYEEWLDEYANKENMEPAPLDKSSDRQFFKGPSVRALIDDEAEDEDEDILVPGEDDEGDEGEDLDDMVVEETNEKVKDREKRAELHRKWLEQQDAVMTDDILLRLKTGWKSRESRKRDLEFLNDEVELFGEEGGDIQESPNENTELLQETHELSKEDSHDVEALKDNADPDEGRAFRSLEDLNDVHESSDDEEAEQRMMRQRFLQESEEQGEFMSPADDETSREIFGLINKVNIASSNKKLKHGSVNDLRYLSGGSSNSNSSFTSKSSFLRRAVSSTLGSVQRQGSSSGSGSRSFIFGRDDSNSSHSFDQQVSLRENKENLEPTPQGLSKESPQTRHHGQVKDNAKASKPSATRLGPSLFEILRRQSTDLDHSLIKNSFEGGNHPLSPILTAFKPIKSTNTPKGSRRA